MNLKSFKANMTVPDAQALVELKGTPVDVGNITVGSSFRTDYINPASNLQVSDSAMLHSMYVPIKPEVTASYGWVDNAGASGPTVRCPTAGAIWRTRRPISATTCPTTQSTR